MALLGHPLAQADPQSLRAIRSNNRVDVFVAHQLFTSYDYGDDTKYPHFYPVIGPRSGNTVTVRRTEPYPHHSSIFFGCDRVNDGNYWQEGPERGRIVCRDLKIIRPTGQSVEFEQDCDWVRTNAPSPLSDHRHIVVSAPSEDRRIIDFAITLTAKIQVRIEKSNHSLFAVRMAPDLAVTGGSLLFGDNGKNGEQATFGRPSRWMNASGRRGSNTEGVAVFNHPENPWSPPQWFTRDYGFFSPTPMNWLEKPMELAPGQTLHLRYRVLVHADNPNEQALQSLYDRWQAGPPPLKPARQNSLDPAQTLVPLNLKLPIPQFGTGPVDILLSEHLEKPLDRPRPAFLVPEGTRLLSAQTKVTSSDLKPLKGDLTLLVDGKKDADQPNLLVLHRGLQWVQLDLGQPARLAAIALWHGDATVFVMHDVIVQIADDEAFTTNVRTLFNNDFDDSAGLGTGLDKEYFETYEGRLVPAEGSIARYVRLYSQGQTLPTGDFSPANHYTEVEVYGIPATETLP